LTGVHAVQQADEGLRVWKADAAALFLQQENIDRLGNAIASLFTNGAEDNVHAAPRRATRVVRDDPELRVGRLATESEGAGDGELLHQS
jgi:hypothetical protein